MTQRRRNRHRKRRVGRRAFLIGLGGSVSAALTYYPVSYTHLTLPTIYSV